MIRQLKPSILLTSPGLSKRRIKPSSSGFIPWQLMPLLIMCLYISVTSNIHAEAYLPAIGGSGGGQFKVPCPQGQNLMGFELRTGDDVDAIRPVCVISYGPIKFNAPPVTSAWSGGPGGQFAQLLCPAQTPVVIGLFVAAEGVDTIVVNNIHLYCGQAASTQTKEIYPSEIFDAPGYTPSPAWLGIGIDGNLAHESRKQQRCPDGQVAVGVHGRSGIWLDAMGLICDTPRLTAEPHYMSLGRVKGSATTNLPPQSICDSARSARARNSPAAPALEAQCQASGEIHYKSLGRVNTSATTDAPPRTICESAQSARARNSPAAPALEAQCKAAEAAQAAQTQLFETESAVAQIEPVATVVPAAPLNPPVPTAVPVVPPIPPGPAAVPVAENAQKINGLTPLVQYWNGKRSDNFVTATAKGAKSAKKAGYKAVRSEACIFKTQQPGTVSLKLYWSKQREDFFTTATVEGIQSANQAAYKFVRNEGYVYPEPAPDNTRTPLKLYWSKARKDYYTTGTTEGAQNAEQTGYVLARIEGYALPASECQ
jgi:hypothetical protein